MSERGNEAILSVDESQRYRKHKGKGTSFYCLSASGTDNFIGMDRKEDLMTAGRSFGSTANSLIWCFPDEQETTPYDIIPMR